MNKKLFNLIAYFLKNYPHKDELSNARLTKMIYLSDWYSAIHHEVQVTNIKWYFDNHGPFVWDIKNEVERNPEYFLIHETLNMFGGKKRLIKLKKDLTVSLTDIEEAAAKHIIQVTKDLNYDDFIKLVYSTYPIATTEKYSSLNLVTKAAKYLEE